jgi:AcrR family transcriptional regulator
VSTARRTQAERTATTRAALLAAARDLFAEQGFAGTGREQIVERAGVTRGALYHHFATKEDVFRELVEQLEQEMLERVAAAGAGAADPAAMLRAGAHAFLDAAIEPAFRRIVLLDAPAVLGATTWREIDARHGLGLVREVLAAAADAGLLPPEPIEPLASMLLGALNEAAIALATAADPGAARAEVGAAVDFLLDRLLG